MTELEWQAVETAYRAGARSVNSLAKEYGISEGTIRNRAKKNGWARSPAKAKRELVSAAMSGITNGVANCEVRNLINVKAEQDVQDMQDLLSVARACVRKLFIMVEESTRPTDIKTIVDANKNAMETIRRIRGLDADDKDSSSVADAIRAACEQR